MNKQQINDLPNVKFWFGNNPELVKKFRAEIKRLTGEAILIGCSDEYIHVIFKEGVDKNVWSYMPDNENNYFENHKYKEMNPNMIINDTWKMRLSQ